MFDVLCCILWEGGGGRGGGGGTTPHMARVSCCSRCVALATHKFKSFDTNTQAQQRNKNACGNGAGVNTKQKTKTTWVVLSSGINKYTSQAILASQDWLATPVIRPDIFTDTYALAKICTHTNDRLIQRSQTNSSGTINKNATNSCEPARSESFLHPRLELRAA